MQRTMIATAKAVLIAGLTGLSACGVTDTPSFTDQVREIAEANRAEQPALWELSDEDTQIFLFGTVHTLRPETDWLTQRVTERVEAANAVYFEADTESQRAQDGIEIAVTRLGLYAPGERLRDALEPDEIAQVEEAAALVGVPFSGFDTFRPWIVSATLSQMYAEERGFADEAGVEDVLGEIAAAANRPLRYLETGAEQMELLASIPEPNQIDMLVGTAEQMLEQPTLLDEMVAEWQAGDVAGLAELIAEDTVFKGAARDILLKGRNENWTGQIETLLEEEAGVFFIAVGAAHLAGDESVQDMLRARGHTVQRVDSKSEIAP